MNLNRRGFKTLAALHRITSELLLLYSISSKLAQAVLHLYHLLSYFFKPHPIYLSQSTIAPPMHNRIQYFPSFIEKRKRQAELMAQRRQQQEMAQEIPRRAQVELEEVAVVKKVNNDEIVTNGTILRVKADTLLDNQFFVTCLYKEVEMEAIASREEIVDKNLGALLDYFEAKLGIVYQCDQ